MITYDDLWKVAVKQAESAGKDPESIFLDVLGLRLGRPPLSKWDYQSTPINSSTFASTGGDGVHFGFLHVDSDMDERLPIVMTVPMYFENPNIVVGANLFEFLCLGCQIGWFSLENLVYNQQKTISWLKNPETYWTAGGEDDPFMIKARQLLSGLVSELGLKPWNEFEERLVELQAKFMPFVQVSDP